MKHEMTNDIRIDIRKRYLHPSSQMNIGLYKHGILLKRYFHTWRTSKMSLPPSAHSHNAVHSLLTSEPTSILRIRLVNQSTYIIFGGIAKLFSVWIKIENWVPFVRIGVNISKQIIICVALDPNIGSRLLLYCFFFFDKGDSKGFKSLVLVFDVSGYLAGY